MIETTFRGGPVDGLAATWSVQPPWVLYIEPPTMAEQLFPLATNAIREVQTLTVVEDEGKVDRYNLVGTEIDGECVQWSYWHESRNDAIPFVVDE